MDRPRPLITIAIPVYNGAEFLGEALRSVLEQSFADFELLISDDGSTDASVKIVKAVSDPRIEIHQYPRGGMAANWNRCLTLARGKYIKVMGQDDLLRPDCLAQQLTLLAECSNPALAFCRRTVIHERSDHQSASWAERHEILDQGLQPLNRVNSGTELLSRWSRDEFRHNLIGEPVTAMFPTALARTLGGFSVRLRQNIDYAFWIRLLPHGDVCFTPEELCSFRFHKNSSTYRHLGVGSPLLERLQLLDELLDDPAINQSHSGLKQLKRTAFSETAKKLARRLISCNLSWAGLHGRADDVSSFLLYCLSHRS